MLIVLTIHLYFLKIKIDGTIRGNHVKYPPAFKRKDEDKNYLFI